MHKMLNQLKNQCKITPIAMDVKQKEILNSVSTLLHVNGDKNKCYLF